jgi:hypothetical protein
VLPKPAPKTITLQCLKGGAWSTRKTGRTSATGTYRLRLKLTSRKRTTCRVALGAGPTLAGGHSRSVVTQAK